MVKGLNYAHFMYLRTVAEGAAEAVEADDKVRRHCELRRWVLKDRLTDDGREVLRRAEADPPSKHVFLSEQGRRAQAAKRSSR